MRRRQGFIVSFKLHWLRGPLRSGPGRQPSHFLAQEPESAAGECGRRQGGAGPGAGLGPGPRGTADSDRDLTSLFRLAPAKSEGQVHRWLQAGTYSRDRFGVAVSYPALPAGRQ